MAKYYGSIGYASMVRNEDIYTEKITERQYFGDFLRNSRNLQSSGNVNDNISISNQLSIVADPYARENFHDMRYVTYNGTKWKISTVEVQYPRLILTLGGIYNAQEN